MEMEGSGWAASQCTKHNMRRMEQVCKKWSAAERPEQCCETCELREYEWSECSVESSRVGSRRGESYREWCTVRFEFASVRFERPAVARERSARE